MVEQAWLNIAKVGKPYGLRGAFYISARNEPFPPQCKTVAIGTIPDQAPQFKVSKVHPQGDREVMVVDGFSDRTTVEKYVHTPIWVLADDLRSRLAENEYFWADIIGKVIEDCTGNVIGTVTAVDNHGASDFVEITDTTGKRLSLPLIKNYFDMGFSALSPSLRLVVPASLFAELWESS